MWSVTVCAIEFTYSAFTSSKNLCQPHSLRLSCGDTNGHHAVVLFDPCLFSISGNWICHRSVQGFSPMKKASWHFQISTLKIAFSHWYAKLKLKKLASKRKVPLCEMQIVFEKCATNKRRFDCLFHASCKQNFSFFGGKINNIYHTVDSTEDIK